MGPDMRTIVLAMFAVCLAHAAPATSQETEDVCAVMGDIAQNIMTARQNERPMSDVMQVMKHDTEPAVHPVIRALIIDAYRQPGYSTEENQKNAIDSFRNAAELACYTAQP